MSTEIKTKEIPMPFDCQIMDSEPQVVKNKFGYGECVLTPQAIAVYDTIQGAEMFGLWTTVRKGLDWFRKYYPKEYMILLD